VNTLSIRYWSRSAWALGPRHLLGFRPTRQLLHHRRLVLAVVSIVLGGAIYLIAYAARPVGAPPWRCAAEYLPAANLSPIKAASRWRLLRNLRPALAGLFRWSNVDKIYLAVWSCLRLYRSTGRHLRLDGTPRHCPCHRLAAAIFARAPLFIPASSGALTGANDLPMPLLIVAAVAIASLALLIASFASPASRKLVPLLSFR